MGAYLVVEHIITDAPKFEEYRTKVGPMLAKRGERYRRDSAGQAPQSLPASFADARAVLEILIGQMAEDREINALLGEALGVLPQPEFLQPCRNRLH